jgi:hypothetical protein
MLIITYTPMYSARRIVINFCVPQLLQLIKTILIGPIGNGAKRNDFRNVDAECVLPARDESISFNYHFSNDLT